MDSTTVSIISDAATKLGMTGASAFGWYLVSKVGVHVLWAGFCVFLVWKTSSVVQSIGNGQRALKAWASSYKSTTVYYLDDNDAEALIRYIGQYKRGN